MWWRWKPMTPSIAETTRDEFLWCLDTAKPHRLRSLRQFAEEEIVIPEGPYQGNRLRIARQPYVGLLYDAIDSGRWPHVACVGPVQSGKSLCAWAIPILWHLFEAAETVVCGVPQMDVAADKWNKELRPLIVRTRYAHLLPTTGRGSRGGVPEALEFRHGVTLKLMSGRGGDEKRSSFTSRVAVCTEVDKYDTAGLTSREAGPVDQIEARTLAYGDDRRFIEECTASLPTGRIWRQYLQGTQSRIVCPCPHCGHWVGPERDDLVGWQEAQNKVEARRMAHFVCPACKKPIDGTQRRRMNLRAKLIHAGQEIDPDGEIHGTASPTDTLGFRWSAFNNLFWSAGTIGAAEWTARADYDEDAAAKQLNQFWWALPWVAPDQEINRIEPDKIRRRTSPRPRGQVADDAAFLTIGVDVGKFLFHYVSIAWRKDSGGEIVDYGVLEADADNLGTQRAAELALAQLRDLVAAGYPRQTGGTIRATQVWIDSGYHETKDQVYAFCREKRNRDLFIPAKGYGYLQQRNRTYRQPTKKGADVRVIGLQYHLNRLPEHRVRLAHVNADFWKSDLHERLKLPPEAPRALSLFLAPENEHRRFAKHLDAERQKQAEVPGRGQVIVWETIRRGNHYLDASYLADAAAHRAAAMLARKSTQATTWWAKS